MRFDIRKSVKDKYTRYALMIILAAIVIRFALAVISAVSGDACWHLSASRFIGRDLSIPLFEPLGRSVFWAPPLFHLFTAASYLSFNWLISDISLKLISPIFGSLFLLYSFLLVKKLFNSKTAFYSTVFLAFIPGHMYESSIGYVDTTLAFFVLASIYYMLEDRLILSSALAGLALLAKVSAFFMLPVILYIIFTKTRKDFLKKSAIFIIVAFAIASPWYLRDWMYLGNPIWPYFNNLFGGYQDFSTSELGFGQLNADISSLSTSFYLSLFGVPNGNIDNLTILNPYMALIWLAATAVFFFFFLVGLRNVKRSFGFDVINILLISFLIFNLLISFTINLFIIRYILPAMTFFAVYWALGIERFVNKRTVVALIAISAIIFVSGEFGKAFVANDMWNKYEDDFNWIKSNTEKDAVFLTPNSQCNSYKFDRYAYSIVFFEFINKTTAEDFIDYNISYVFYPENSDMVISKFDKDVPLDGTLVYENKNTKIKIYRIA
ncbi:MAG: glycosyltransferase family 39 protein [Candidatus Aenigmatarchaeota archaeon]